ncbi:MAG: protein of unknown function DUF6 transmembrane [uncultured bacterium]|nr:MAG: protein of unknown function DUF6 transmembrane [uncultured bacterium]
MPNTSIKITATFLILVATLFWGMTFSFIKDAVSTLSAFNFLFWRFSIASMLLLAISYKQIHFFNRELFFKGVLLGIFLGGTVIFQTIGLRYTQASTASFIAGLSVILVAIIACILEKKRPTINIISAIFLTMLGIGLITLTPHLEFNIGNLWIILCEICFAVYILLAGKFSHTNEPITLTFFQLLCISIISAVINFTFGDFSIPMHTNLWVSILFCAIFASVIAFNLQLKYQRYVSSTKAAIIFASEPIFATITAIIYLDEHLTTRFIIGAICIFSAILLAEMRGKSSH